MKKIFGVILSCFLWLFGLTAFFLWAVLILLISIFTVGRVFELCVKLACRSVLLVLGIRIKVKNLENYDYRKQYIVMMNHVNMFDPFLFYSRFKGKARAIEEQGHFHWPVYGWLIRRIGQIPVNRKSGRQALESLKKAIELIKSKKNVSITILPEGTRTMTGKLGEFKKGGFLLAIESGLDILPIIQLGSFKIKRKRCWIVRPGKVEYIFEKAISTTGYTRKNIEELIKKTREVFLQYVD